MRRFLFCICALALVLVVCSEASAQRRLFGRFRQPAPVYTGAETQRVGIDGTTQPVTPTATVYTVSTDRYGRTMYYPRQVVSQPVYDSSGKQIGYGYSDGSTIRLMPDQVAKDQPEKIGAPKESRTDETVLTTAVPLTTAQPYTMDTRRPRMGLFARLAARRGRY